jgi:hypothetical protein
LTIDWIRALEGNRSFASSDWLLIVLLIGALVAIPAQVFPCSAGAFLPLDGGFAWDALRGVPGDPFSSYEPNTWNAITAIQGLGAIATLALAVALKSRSRPMIKLAVTLTVLAICCTVAGVIARRMLWPRPHPLDIVLSGYCSAVCVLVRRRLLLTLPADERGWRHLFTLW